MLWIIYVVADTDALAWTFRVAAHRRRPRVHDAGDLGPPSAGGRGRPLRTACRAALPIAVVGLHGLLARRRSFSSSWPRPASAGVDGEAVVPDPRPARPPLHPPLTDVTIGAYTFATIAAVLDVTNAVERDAAHAWWIALLVGLASTALTATTGFADWIAIEWGSPTWKTATAHLSAMRARPAFSSQPSWSVIHGGTTGNVTAGAFLLSSSASPSRPTRRAGSAAHSSSGTDCASQKDDAGA